MPALHRVFLWFFLPSAAMALAWYGTAPGLQVSLLEDFEQQTCWQQWNQKPMAARSRILEKEPWADEQNRAQYLQDISLLNQSLPQPAKTVVDQGRFSCEIQVFFNHPGQESAVLAPPGSNLSISASQRYFHTPGRALALAVWVYGYDKKHSLWALFRRPDGRYHEIPMGNLDFGGWKRLQVNVPLYASQSQAMNRAEKFSQFAGFRLKSSEQEEAGLYLFHFDLVMLQTENLPDYPGRQLQEP